MGRGKRNAEPQLALDSDDELLVHADALIEAGDPRGELAHLQHQRSRGDTAKLRTAEAKHLKQHAAALLGPVAPDHVTWRLGYFDRVRIDRGGADAIAEVLAHPSARLVRTLEVATDHAELPAAILELARRPRPTLRALVLHQRSRGRSGKPAYSTTPDTHDHERGDALWPMLPNLERLELAGFSLFHTIALPNVTELVFDGLPICDRGRAWKVPKLARVRWRVSHEQLRPYIERGVDLLAALWKWKHPALRHIDLSDCEPVGYVHYRSRFGSSEEFEDDIHEVREFLSFELQHKAGFRKLAPQLDELVLPRGRHLTTRAAIANWLDDA
ncbi:MAG TPA: hypothetical protein VFQ53_21155 [Kofleriaceae bacterium]|nr:hypothetical protein [Kofleriaceae bacterium]